MANERLPKRLWRVVATGGQRHYWEAASKQYSREEYARDKAAEYLRRGATEVKIYYTDPVWVEVTDGA